VVGLVGRNEEVADDEELGVQRETEGALRARRRVDDANATRRSAEAILNLGETSFALARSGRPTRNDAILGAPNANLKGYLAAM